MRTTDLQTKQQICRKISLDEMKLYLLKRGNNIVAKGDIAHYASFLLLLQYFQKLSICRSAYKYMNLYLCKTDFTRAFIVQKNAITDHCLNIRNTEIATRINIHIAYFMSVYPLSLLINEFIKSVSK